MKVLGAYRGGAGGYYRVVAPFSVLEYSTEHTFKVAIPTTESVEEYDLLWLYQHADPVAEIVARAFRDAGKPVIYDVDDWIFGMPASWPGYGDYFLRGAAVGTERLHYHQRLLEIASVVTCPTALLAEKLREHLDLSDVRVLPNCILQGDWDTVEAAEYDLSGPVLGWFGTGTHWDDWCEIAGAVDEALEAVDGRLALIGAPEVVGAFPDRLAERTRVQPLVPINKFRGVRRLVKTFDVGLTWCSDRFMANRCRSPLKALQYGAAGVPVVASQTVYGDLPGWWDEQYRRVAPVQEHDYGVTVATVKYLAYTLEKMLGDRRTIKRIRESAATWQDEVWASHSYEMQATRWLELAKEVTGGSGAD